MTFARSIWKHVAADNVSSAQLEHGVTFNITELKYSVRDSNIIYNLTFKK